MENELIEVFEKTIPVENFDLIPIHFFCEEFGIDRDISQKLLSGNQRFSSHIKKISNEGIFGDKAKHIHLDRKGFIAFVMHIPVANAKPELRELLLDYQMEVLDYLYGNANQQEAILKRGVALKKERSEIYAKLISENKDFKRYIDITANIARLGKENKTVQNKIAGGIFEFEFPEE
jgi:hypothetical protein